MKIIPTYQIFFTWCEVMHKEKYVCMGTAERAKRFNILEQMLLECKTSLSHLVDGDKRIDNFVDELEWE